MITYNHESFISEAIKSVLSQQVDFSLEVVISNDCSTDNTHRIIEELIKSNTNLNIKFSYTNQKSNLGVMPNFIFALKKCQGKYIALCEGDDYWIDPLKLKKQVTFLEQNNDVSIAFTKAKTLRCNDLIDFDKPKSVNKKFDFIELLVHQNFIATASVMLKREDVFDKLEQIKKSPFGDIALYKIATLKKKLAYISDVTTVYRVHDRGFWSGTTTIMKEKNYLKFYDALFPFFISEEKTEIKRLTKLKIYKLSRLNFPKNRIMQLIYKLYYRIMYLKLWL